MKKVKRVRKPRDYVLVEDHYKEHLSVDSMIGKPKHLRKLAAWLLKSADWLEQQEKK